MSFFNDLSTDQIRVRDEFGGITKMCGEEPPSARKVMGKPDIIEVSYTAASPESQKMAAQMYLALRGINDESGLVALDSFPKSTSTEFLQEVDGKPTLKAVHLQVKMNNVDAALQKVSELREKVAFHFYEMAIREASIAARDKKGGNLSPEIISQKLYELAKPYVADAPLNIKQTYDSLDSVNQKPALRHFERTIADAIKTAKEAGVSANRIGYKLQDEALFVSNYISPNVAVMQTHFDAMVKAAVDLGRSAGIPEDKIRDTFLNALKQSKDMEQPQAWGVRIQSGGNTTPSGRNNF